MIILILKIHAKFRCHLMSLYIPIGVISRFIPSFVFPFFLKKLPSELLIPFFFWFLDKESWLLLVELNGLAVLTCIVSITDRLKQKVDIFLRQVFLTPTRITIVSITDQL